MLSLSLLVCLAIVPTAPERQVGVPIGKGTTKPTVTITAPTGGWTQGRMITVAGSVSDRTVDPVIISINGDRYLMRTLSGSFSRQFPASSGKNIVTVMATNKGGTGSAQVTTYANIPPVPLKTILTSDTEGVYTDLHVWEPTDNSVKDGKIDVSNMMHVYWANTESPTGGTFFLNEQGGSFDQPAYGPYLYIHRAPPLGVYLIAANYWPSGDKAHTIATLNLTLFEGTPQEIKRLVQIPLATPGTTRVLAFINMVSSDKALVYVPGQDKVPQSDVWPNNLDEATKNLNTSGGGGGDDDYYGD